MHALYIQLLQTHSGNHKLSFGGDIVGGMALAVHFFQDIFKNLDTVPTQRSLRHKG